MKLATPKGFRDFLPEDALKRKFVLGKITEVFEKFGFDPLETPTLEYAETLKGKYGEEEKLIYKFETPGGDKVALRYDQTVPLARVIAQYGPKGEQKLPMPFKRYQIQSAFRGENTQKGRYREFLQCDIDIVGISSIYSDAEIIAVVDTCLKTLGFRDYEIRVNNRELLFNKIREVGIKDELILEVIREIDKLDKYGSWDNLTPKLIELGVSEEQASKLDSTLSVIQDITQYPYLNDLISACKKFGVSSVIPRLYLARGLDYYTGLIFEVVIPKYGLDKSIGGGGRYDDLIGKFTGDSLPAVGFSFGIDRTIEAMEEEGVLNLPKTTAKVLVTVFSPELMEKSLEVSSRLRSNNIPTELYLDQETKLEKQLKYADQKGIPYAVIIGPDEAAQQKIVLKNLSARSQETLSVDELLQKLSS